MNAPADFSELEKMLARVSSMLPDLFAVFDAEQLLLLHINPAGKSLLDPTGIRAETKMLLTDIVGVNDIDRFRREVYPQTKVLGHWSGTLMLRDFLGSEFTRQVKLLELIVPSTPGRHCFCLHASPTTGEGAKGNQVTDSDMLYALLDTTHSYIYFKDVASRYLRISRAKAAQHGLADPRDAVGKTDFDYFTAEHAAPAFQDEQRIVKTNQPVIDLEEKETYSDGSISWVSTTKLPFYNRAGKLIGTYGISRDITERKATEEKLRMLSRAVEQSSISIVITDTQGLIEYVNPYFEKNTGYSAAEAIGQNPRVLKSGHQPPELYRTMWEEITSGREWNGELQNRRKNGEFFWERASISGIRNEQGQTTHFIAVKEDITARKKAEESLRESEALFRAVFDGSSDAVVLLSDNRFLDFNAKALEMFGCSKEELRMLHPADLSPPLQPDGRDSLSASKEYIELALEKGHCRFDWMHRRRDNTDFPAEVFLSSFEFHGRTIIHGTVRDVSEQRQAEKERRELEARLQLSSKLESVGSLAAGVAHEINTPTQFISDNIRFLIDSFGQLSQVVASYRAHITEHPECGKSLKNIADAEAENELDYLVSEIPRCLEQSLDGLKRIAKIVGSLKEFSHPGGEEKSHADINRAIETTIAVSRHEWKYVADVVTELDPELPLVNCVLDEINQAVLNLVVNAAHAIEDAIKVRKDKRGSITIRTRKEGDTVIIEVRDTGTGIPEHVRGRIFEPFFTTKGIGKGTGQGLAIVQAVVVKKHHGTIGFTTELGQGTTFKISLPIAPVRTTPPVLPL